MDGCRHEINTFNDITVTLHSLGEINIEFRHCHVLRFKSENKGSSTHPHLGKLLHLHRKINMPHFLELLPTLNDLLTEKNHNAVKFRKNIQSFNSGLAIVSHIVDETIIRTGAPGAYTIKGMVYRKLGTMTLIPGKYSRCLKTYFHNPDYQHQKRALFLQENLEELDNDH